MEKTQYNQIDERLRELFSLLFQVNAQEINDDSSPETIPAWNSLQHLNLILALEEEFQISITPDQATRIRNFRTAAEAVIAPTKGAPRG